MQNKNRLMTYTGFFFFFRLPLGPDFLRSGSVRGVSICHLAQEILTPQMARKADTSVSPPTLSPNLRQRLVTSPWLAVRWGLGAGDWLVSSLSRARLRVTDRPAGAWPTSVPRFVYVVPFCHNPACL